MRCFKTLKQVVAHESVLDYSRKTARTLVWLREGWTHFDGTNTVRGGNVAEVIEQFNEGKVCRVADLKRVPKEITTTMKRLWSRDGESTRYIVTYRMRLVGVDETGPTYKPTEVISEVGRPPWETSNPLHTQMSCSWASMGERPAEYGLTAADVAGIPERYSDDVQFNQLRAALRKAAP